MDVPLSARRNHCTPNDFAVSVCVNGTPPQADLESASLNCSEFAVVMWIEVVLLIHLCCCFQCQSGLHPAKYVL